MAAPSGVATFHCKQQEGLLNMKVKILKSVAGYDPDGEDYVYTTDDVVDLDKKTAEQFLSGDDPIAEPVAKRAVDKAKKAVASKGKESR